MPIRRPVPPPPKLPHPGDTYAPAKPTRLMWRIRPFAGGPWVVCDTTKRATDWLTEHAVLEERFEIQLVEMDEDEYKDLPVK